MVPGSPVVGFSCTNASTGGGSGVAAWLVQINKPRIATKEMAITLTGKMSQFLDLYVVPFIFDASFCCRKIWQIRGTCKDAIFQTNVPEQHGCCSAALICAIISS
jgi:hypothetical protein